MPRKTKEKEMEKWLNETKLNIFMIETPTFKAPFAFNSKKTLEEIEQWCHENHPGWTTLEAMKISVYQIVM